MRKEDPKVRKMTEGMGWKQKIRHNPERHIWVHGFMNAGNHNRYYSKEDAADLRNTRMINRKLSTDNQQC